MTTLTFTPVSELIIDYSTNNPRTLLGTFSGDEIFPNSLAVIFSPAFDNFLIEDNNLYIASPPKNNYIVVSINLSIVSINWYTYTLHIECDIPNENIVSTIFTNTYSGNHIAPLLVLAKDLTGKVLPKKTQTDLTGKSIDNIECNTESVDLFFTNNINFPSNNYIQINDNFFVEYVGDKTVFTIKNTNENLITDSTTGFKYLWFTYFHDIYSQYIPGLSVKIKVIFTDPIPNLIIPTITPTPTPTVTATPLIEPTPTITPTVTPTIGLTVTPTWTPTPSASKKVIVNYVNPTPTPSKVTVTAIPLTNKIIKTSINIVSPDDAVAPMLDTEQMSYTYIKNIINTMGDPSTELTASGGQALCRYILSPVTLNSDIKASLLHIWFAASIPTECFIRVYYRTLNTIEDSERDIKTKYWRYVGDTSTTKTAKDEFVDFEFLVEEIDYYDDTSIKEFNQFSIKLVLESSDSAKIPLIKDFRVIALS